MTDGEQLYTLVDEQGRPVYTHDGMDGHFALATSFADMTTVTAKCGWSQMMRLAQWSHDHCGNGRMKVFPAKVTIQIERVPIS